jgi:hypothetical protein
MTVQTVNVSTLKRVKNNVIGNPSAKLLLAQDELFVDTSVSTLSFLILLTLTQPRQSPQRTRTIRGCCGITGQYPCRGRPCHHLLILWCAIIARGVFFTYEYPFSLLPFLGSPQALRSLLHANAHQAFLYAISRFDPSEPTATKAAFARALRAIAAACAELVGPSQWGLRDDSSPVREEAKLALDYFFQVIALRNPASRSSRLTNNSVARSSRCVPPSPHGYLGAGRNIYRAAPCCGTSRTKSSYCCCGMGPSGRTWTRSFPGPAPLGTPRGYSARALRWWWVGRTSSHVIATQPRCQGTGSRLNSVGLPGERQPRCRCSAS